MARYRESRWRYLESHLSGIRINISKVEMSVTEPESAAFIGARVRALRSARRLTQARLAQELHVTQGRLSDLERGKASFTAEQFLAILRIFNVPASEFVPPSESIESDLQNAVARLGARHLFEVDHVVPSERFREVHAVVREVLADARSPRMIAGLAPVLVEHADTINLAKLALDLNQIGLERRLYISLAFIASSEISLGSS